MYSAHPRLPVYVTPHQRRQCRLIHKKLPLDRKQRVWEEANINTYKCQTKKGVGKSDLFLGALRPSDISGHVKMGADLLLYALMTTS